MKKRIISLVILLLLLSSGVSADGVYTGLTCMNAIAPGATFTSSSCTSGMVVPAGTTAQRPGTPVANTVRLNTDLTSFESYDGTAWNQLSNLVIYRGTSAQYKPKYFTKSVTVSAGTAVFYLTSDGTSGGAALFTTVFPESANVYVSDASGIYPYSLAISTDQKTVTVTINKSANTAISLLGISLLSALAAAPNGTTVNLTVMGT